MAVCQTETDESHVVLVVKTINGKFVLENLTERIIPLGKAMIMVRKMDSADQTVLRLGLTAQPATRRYMRKSGAIALRTR
jgi:predicted transglutaminase-like cysteine proteinase